MALEISLNHGPEKCQLRHVKLKIRLHPESVADATGHQHVTAEISLQGRREHYILPQHLQLQTRASCGVNVDKTWSMQVKRLIYMWESDSRRPRHTGEPSMTKKSSSSRAPKTGALQDSTPLGRVRKAAQNAPKSTQFGLQIVSMTESEVPPLLSARTGMSTTSSVNATAEHCLNRQQPCSRTALWNLPSVAQLDCPGTLSRELNRERTVRLDCWNKRCMITATSTTPQDLHLRQFHCFLHCRYQHLSVHKTGTTTRPKNCNCGISTVFCTTALCGPVSV